MLIPAVDAVGARARVFVAPFGTCRHSIGRTTGRIRTHCAAARCAVLIRARFLRAPYLATWCRRSSAGGGALRIIAARTSLHLAVRVRAPRGTAIERRLAFRVGAILATVNVARLCAAPRSATHGHWRRCDTLTRRIVTARAVIHTAVICIAPCCATGQIFLATRIVASGALGSGTRERIAP